MKKELLGAYTSGLMARKKGVKVGDNPYDEENVEFWSWMKGWVDGVDKKPMKISEFIKNEWREAIAASNVRNGIPIDDHDLGYTAALIRCCKIAEKHEAEHGWLPIEGAPKDETQVIRESKGGPRMFAHWSDDHSSWLLGAQALSMRVFPIEWYKFEGEA